jgi:hypothetical protein
MFVSLEMETGGSSETLVSARSHGVISWKTVTLTFTVAHAHITHDTKCTFLYACKYHVLTIFRSCRLIC